MSSSRMLYKYFSFEKFVDMQQKKALTLVLPEKWEDPTEKAIFDVIINQLDIPSMKALLNIYKWNTYCQSWTTLDESDAMWRIYSSNNKSIRIRLLEQDLLNLSDQFIIKNVEYTDKKIEVPEYSEENVAVYGKIIGELMLYSLTKKRTAFSHEKEVRLIRPASISIKENNVHDYFFAYFKYKYCIGDEEIISSLEGKKLKIDSQEYSKICELLNVGDTKKDTLDVSFANKPDLIKGVMVHPLAPNWYVETVKTFCYNNNIPFDGKSTLYS